MTNYSKQPVSHLTNYDKYITPVLKAGKSVMLMNGKKVYGVIITPKQAEADKHNRQFISGLISKSLGKSYHDLMRDKQAIHSGSEK